MAGNHCPGNANKKFDNFIISITGKDVKKNGEESPIL